MTENRPPWTHAPVAGGAPTRLDSPDAPSVEVRRLLLYLEQSLQAGTQWVVFEPNGESLWAKVRTTVEDFLFNEWKSGTLQGPKPEQAFYVRCDRTTITQNDIDNGQLICIVGVALVKSAEFLVLRIGQWTADRKCGGPTQPPC